MGRFASETSVPAERTRAEIEATLTRYGATAYHSGWRPGESVIGFVIKDLSVRFTLPIPAKSEQGFVWKVARGQKVKRSERQAEAAWDQEVRQRWRTLLLVIKAKLEAVEVGISSVEREFMAWVVLPNDQLLGDWLIDNAVAAIRGGSMPPMLGPAEPQPEEE